MEINYSKKALVSSKAINLSIFAFRQHKPQIFRLNPSERPILQVFAPQKLGVLPV
jgi:hypothetical protein